MFQRITPLEDRLFEDRKGIYRAHVMRLLNDERTRLGAYLQQPCSKEQCRNIVWQCAAIEYAQAVIDAIWNIYHVRS